MKNLNKYNVCATILLLALTAIFTMSLSVRKAEQIVVHGNNVTAVVAQMNSLYRNGYRVTHVTAQSISASNNQDAPAIYGEIIVVMEK